MAKGRAEWMQGLPAKRVGAAMLLYNSSGEVLLQDPSYRDGWILPGGVVEAEESPLIGALREVEEELELQLWPQDCRLSGVVYYQLLGTTQTF